MYHALIDLGFEIGINTVLKLMNELNLHPYTKKKHYHSFMGSLGKFCKNLVNKNFHADNPYELLFSDVTMIVTPFGNLYLSPVVDAFNNEILSYDLSEHPNKEQAVKTFYGLNKVLPEWSRPILHTDQGWQYKNDDIIEILKSLGITQSMSRKGNCLDNAQMESWFSRLKMEMIYNSNFNSLEEVKQAIHDYIKFYNEIRIQSKLGWTSPVKYRKQYEENLEKEENSENKTENKNISSVFTRFFHSAFENFLGNSKKAL